MNPFIFFDVDQTLISEWEFLRFIDNKIFLLINNYGARIDYRNYSALKDNILRNRKIKTTETITDLVYEISRITLPTGYDKIILKKIIPDIIFGKQNLLSLYQDTKETLNSLKADHKLGIISSQSNEIQNILRLNGLNDIFHIKHFIKETGSEKQNRLEIFRNAIQATNYPLEDIIMVGDRLDLDIYPAKKLGIKTIRFLDSIFRIQRPRNENEIPDYEISKLSQIPDILNRIKT